MIEQTSKFRYGATAGTIPKQTRREQTFEEEILWQNLRSNRMLDLRFRRKHAVEGYIIDFYCISRKLAIEVRGSCIDEDGEFDSYKDLTLAAAGVRTIRFTKSEVRYQLPKVLQRIRDACSV